jgi:hypothetical protein
VLDRFDAAAAMKVRARERWETGTGFDYNVDQRIGFRWQRLENGSQPFNPSQVEESRQTLPDLMRTVPRLTAPALNRHAGQNTGT